MREARGCGRRNPAPPAPSVLALALNRGEAPRGKLGWLRRSSVQCPRLRRGWRLEAEHPERGEHHLVTRGIQAFAGIEFDLLDFAEAGCKGGHQFRPAPLVEPQSHPGKMPLAAGAQGL